MDRTIKTIKRVTKSKTGNSEDCEDAIAVTNNHACVIDGATSIYKYKWDGKSGGQIAAKAIKDKIQTLERDANVNEVINQLTNSISKIYKQRGLYKKLENEPEYRVSASVAIYSIHHNELWLIGDCQALVDSQQITNKKKIDNIMAEARSMYIAIEMMKGKSKKQIMQNDSGRRFIKPLLGNQKWFQNNPNAPDQYVYAAIDGFPVYMDGVLVHNVSKSVDEIVLASDGYPELYHDLEKTERNLSKIIEDDPLFFDRYKSTHGLNTENLMHDDRSFLKIRIE